MKTINPRWQRIQALFNQAADLPLAERTPFLDAQCGRDLDLRRELERLLEADAGPPSDVRSGIHVNSLLTKSLGIAAGNIQRDRRTELIGTVIGAYRLTAVLGHGGAGTVYLGERADRQYSAQVAVKIVDSALAHEEVLKRFQAERQILANLNHPNIARLLDAGETPHGQPFLVMEYVHGEPIDRYCDQLRLTIKQRLQLFVKVCAAVQYAHQNLVVHRDIKPGNILVTPDGSPKLLDFGIAKLMDASARAAAEMALTRINDRVLTPEYASPEQILGQNITTTSDVYALGVVLYELLCGVRPYQVNSASQLELERTICILDPPRPSQMLEQIIQEKQKSVTIAAIADTRGTTAKRLPKSIKGDLDAIILRALRKEATQRYLSIEQFIDDIQRTLDNQPVLATQGNWFYYSKRFVSRHTPGVAISAAAIIGLIAVAVILSIQTKRIAQQRDLAEQENERAEAVSNFMQEVFSSSDPFENQGKQITAKELLDNAGKRIADDLSQQPEVRARLLAAIGTAYQRQAQPDSAIKYLEDALRLLRNQPDTPAITIAKTLDALANAQRERGQYSESEAALSEAAATLTSAKQTQTPEYLQILTDTGRTKIFSGDNTNAHRYLLQALNLARTIYGNTHPETAAVLTSIGQNDMWLGNLNEAVEATREAASIYHSYFAATHPDRAQTDQLLGEILTRQGKFSEASDLISNSLNVLKLLYGENSLPVANALDSLSFISKKQNKLNDAEQYAREALDVIIKNLGKSNANTAFYYSALADVLIQRHKYDDAEQNAREALSILKATNNTDHQYAASAEYFLALIYYNTNRKLQAIPVLRANIERWQRANAAPWYTARSQNLLGEILWEQTHNEEAANLLNASYKALTTADSGASEDVIATAKQRLEQANFRP